MKRFRLIDTFDSTIHTFDIRKSPPYLAISHAWSEIFPKQLPLDSSFGGDAIKRTLFKRGLSSVRYCWIDLFSIEQDSEDDVNEQIPLMGEIFGIAEAVLIILTNELNLTQEKIDSGTSQLDEALAIWEMEAWTDNGAREYWELGEGRTKLVQAMDILSCFTKTAWGTRIWTLQEYLLARNVLWIGSDLEPISINDELFIAIPRLCDEFEVAGCTARDLSINNDNSLLFSHFSGMAASRAKSIERTRVMELLGNRKATVPVDEVYGIMAATGVEISVRPKESREAAWKRWLEAALMAGHLRWLMIPPSILSAVQVGSLTCNEVLFSKRHKLSSASGLNAVIPYGPVGVSEGTVSLVVRKIGPCTTIRLLGPVHRCKRGLVHREITLILFSNGNWTSAVDIAVAFGSGRYNNKQLMLIAQVLNNNFSRALRFVQRHMEHQFYPFLATEQIRFIWADFMQLSAQTVMDIMSFGVAYLIRVQCPTTELSFLTVLVTNGLCLKGDIVAFECNARGRPQKYRKKRVIWILPGIKQG
ncbi:HET domain protein [Penicillium longicatenatum]|nr:HET domain protein [Penicillium longicatenatum]